MVLKFEKSEFIKIRWKGIDCYALRPDFFGEPEIQINADNQTSAEEVIEEVGIIAETKKELVAEIEKEEKKAELEAQLKALD